MMAGKGTWEVETLPTKPEGTNKEPSPKRGRRY